MMVTNSACGQGGGGGGGGGGADQQGAPVSRIEKIRQYYLLLLFPPH